MALDPVSVAKLWLLLKPAKRLKAWRKRRAMRSWEGHSRPADEFSEILSPNEGSMSEAQQSFVRGLLKLLAGGLAAKGLIDAGDAAALQVALEAVVAAGIGVWAFWQSHRKHTQA